MFKVSDDQLVFSPPAIRSTSDFLVLMLMVITFFGMGILAAIFAWPPETLFDVIEVTVGFSLFVAGLFIVYRIFGHTEFVLTKDGQVRVYRVQGSRRTLKESLDIENSGSAAVVIERINETGEAFLASIVADRNRTIALCRFKSLAKVRRIACKVAEHLNLELHNQSMSNPEVLTPEVAGLPLMERLPAFDFPAVAEFSKAVEHRALPDGHQFLFKPIGLNAILILLIGLGMVFLILAGLVVGEDIVQTGTFGTDSPGIRVVVACFLVGSICIALAIIEGRFTRWNLYVDSKGLTVEFLRLGFSDRSTIPLADLYEVGVLDSLGEGINNSSSFIVASSKESFLAAHLHHMTDLLTMRALILEFLATRVEASEG